MGKALEKDILGYLGEEFQYNLAKVFMDEPQFFKDIHSIIDPNVFTTPILKRFIGYLNEYFEENSEIPTYETIRLHFRAKATTENDIDECEGLIDKLKTTSLSGVKEIKDNADKFFKQQYYVKIANKILSLAGNGDIDRFDECKELFEKATMIGHEEEFGVSPYDLENEAFSQTYHCPIPTGIDGLDNFLNGGLDKGKLGLIIAPSGYGKTSLTTCLAQNAAVYASPANDYQGYKVLQIFFEDDAVDIAKKHFAKISQFESRELTRTPENIKEARGLVDTFYGKEMMQNNLKLVRMLAGEKSASDIGIFIKRVINNGFRPDLVIIDYFECLKPEKSGYSGDSEWSREGVTMRKLENMAKELNIAIWIPTQGNKASINSSDGVTMDMAGGSIKKVQIAQLVISLARSLDDIDNNLACISILKNRSGKSGKKFYNVKFNNGTSTISCDEMEEYDTNFDFSNAMKEKKAQQTNKLTQGIAEQMRVERTNIEPPKDMWDR